MFTNLDSRKVRRRQSFTLLEVMLALAILVLLTGALFALVQGSLTATAILDQKQHRQAQVDGFLQLCQETFHRLPPRAILQSGVVDVKGGFVPVLVIHNAPGILSWTQNDKGEKGAQELVFAARSQMGGALNLSVLSPPSSVLGNDGKIDPSLFGSNDNQTVAEWLPLLADIRQIEWRFFDPKDNSWINDWSDANRWPRAIELTVTLVEEKEPVRSVILLPQLSHVSPPTFDAPKAF